MDAGATRVENSGCRACLYELAARIPTLPNLSVVGFGSHYDCVSFEKELESVRTAIAQSGREIVVRGLCDEYPDTIGCLEMCAHYKRKGHDIRDP